MSAFDRLTDFAIYQLENPQVEAYRSDLMDSKVSLKRGVPNIRLDIPPDATWVAGEIITEEVPMVIRYEFCEQPVFHNKHPLYIYLINDANQIVVNEYVLLINQDEDNKIVCIPASIHTENVFVEKSEELQVLMQVASGIFLSMTDKEDMV